jgi:CubicO group peptidase (beta-lactamase class C family)
MRSHLLPLALVPLAVPLIAQRVEQRVTTLDGRQLTADSVARTVQQAMARDEVTGVAIAIINRGAVVYLRAFGEANADTHAPLTTRSTMYAASLTKTMFAHLVLQLVDEHLLALDRPIVEYTGPLDTVPKWADIAGDPRHRLITARMLLSHTAGFANFRFVEPDGKMHIHFEPGARYAYSGEGLNLLQYVIERITHTSLTTLMRDRVFTPFGMTHTSMVWDSTFAADLAMGHDSSGHMVGHSRRSSPRAAGSVDTNIEDMARYLVAVLRGSRLSDTSRRTMLSPQIRIRSNHQFPTLDTVTTTRDDGIQLSYGLGWGLVQSPYGPAFFKEGADETTRNHMIAFDRSQSGMIVMTNSGRGDRLFPTLFATLLGDRVSPWDWDNVRPAP